MISSDPKDFERDNAVFCIKKFCQFSFSSVQGTVVKMA